MKTENSTFIIVNWQRECVGWGWGEWIEKALPLYCPVHSAKNWKKKDINLTSGQSGRLMTLVEACGRGI